MNIQMQLQKENLEIEEMFRLKELESVWRKTLPKPNDSIWIETFPEAKEIIPLKIQEWQELYDRLATIVKQKLTGLRQIAKDDFSYWFFREWIKISEGNELSKIKKHIKRLRWLIVDKRKLNSKSITQDDIQRAKEVSLVDIAESDIRLRKSGRTYSGLCPFHQEKSPSFVIYPESNTFVCFGCQKKGDVITYLMDTRKLTFIEAVRWLQKGRL